MNQIGKRVDYNETGRGKGKENIPENPKKSINSVKSLEGGRDRGKNSIPQSGSENKPLIQRKVNQKEACILTTSILQCGTFKELKSLYDAQRGKNYFNYIHAGKFFSKAIDFFTNLKRLETISIEDLLDFNKTAFFYRESFDRTSWLMMAYAATKLLNCAQKNKFEGAGEAEQLACEILCWVFREVIAKKFLPELSALKLANLTSSAVRLLEYTQINFWKKPKNTDQMPKNIEKLALEILGLVIEEVKTRNALPEFDSKALSLIANNAVYAGRSNTTSELFDKIGENVCTRDFNTFSLQSISNLAWSFALMGKPLIDDWLIKGLRLQQNCDGLKIEGAVQFYMAFLRKSLDNKKWDNKNPDAFLGEYFQEAFKQKILECLKKENSVRKSSLQNFIGARLEKILHDDHFLKKEYCIKPYSIDFAIFFKNELIALIEVNGPKHFINGEHNLCHKFKEQLIKDMGYPDIINIDYMDWSKSKNQKSFLEEKLSQIKYKKRVKKEKRPLNPVQIQERSVKPIGQAGSLKVKLHQYVILSLNDDKPLVPSTLVTGVEKTTSTSFEGKLISKPAPKNKQPRIEAEQEKKSFNPVPIQSESAILKCVRNFALSIMPSMALLIVFIMSVNALWYTENR